MGYVRVYCTVWVVLVLFTVCVGYVRVYCTVWDVLVTYCCVWDMLEFIALCGMC